MKSFILIMLSSTVLLFTTGCSEIADEPVSPAFVTLLTRGETEATVAHRLLAFDAIDNEACKLNYSFTSGNTVTLSDGNYRFVTLTESSCLDLPAAGTTDGLSLTGMIPLKVGFPLESILISSVTDITIPQVSYMAHLKPATCLLRLSLIDAPNDLVLQLKNMSDGLSLAGTYTGASTKAFLLSIGENICLPTGDKAVLQFIDSENNSGTLDLGMQLEAGFTYQLTLKWHEGQLTLKSIVETWTSGGTTDGNAE